VRTVILEGLDDDEMRAAAGPKYKVGAKLTSRLDDRLRDRTEANLRAMGYWEAEVLSIERRVDGADVDVVLRVESGARFRLDLETPPESLKIAENAFPDPAREEIHPAQTEALAEQIVENLQESGHLVAEVSAELAVEADEQVLRVAVDPGRKLKVVRIPGAGLYRNALGEVSPASHMNFIIAKGVVVVPVYGTASQEAALAGLQKVFPDRKVVGVPSKGVLGAGAAGGGSFHCITQQEPA